MSFFVRNITTSPAVDVLLNDLGLTIPAGADFDFTPEQPSDVAQSGQVGGDLYTAIDSDWLIILDPLDGTTPLTKDQSIELAQVHNDPHYRIRGGELNQLDDVDVTGAQSGVIYLLTQTPTGSPIVDLWTPVTPADVLAGQARLGDMSDVNTPSPSGSPLGMWSDGEVYVLVGNSSNEVTATPLFGGSPGTPIPGFCEAVEDITAGMITGGTQTDITVTYTDGAGSCDGAINFVVDDVFLRNTGDVLDSGTLEIAPGATLTIKGPLGSPVTEGSLIIEQDAVATIETPTGNFINNNDIVNKEYVDSIAEGLDWKESVRAATSADVSGGSPSLYVPAGGTGGTGNFIGVDLTSDAIWDGVPTLVGGFVVGDRLLVKDEIDARRNGIYVVVSLGGSPLGVSSTIERAPDHDGSPSNEVSAGNTVFVENGDDNLNSQWSVIGDGVLTLNTDDVNWAKTGGSVSILANEGLNSVGNRFNLDISDLTGTATIALGDFVAFDDINAGGAPTDTDTRKTTVLDLVTDLGIPYNITTTGFVVNGAGSPGPYGTVEIVASVLDDELGILVLNGDGQAGDPTIGLDIKGLDPVAAGSPTVDTNDRVAVWDQDADKNVYYTVGQIATALTATNSFSTWAGGAGTTGGPNVATSGADTMTVVGGTGIALDLTAGSDTIEWNLDFNQIPPASGSPGGTPDGDTEIIINIGGTIFTTTINDLLSNTIIASTDEDLLGASVASVGSPAVIEVGVDIVGQTDPDDILAAGDEFLIHDKSEGTAGANRKITGQNVADGVADILNISVEIIGGTFSPAQTQLFILDPTTGVKLSVAEVTMTFSDNIVQNDGWIEIGNAVDALSGYIIPMDAKLVRVSGHTSSKLAAVKPIRLYKNGALFGTDPFFDFPAGAGEATFYDASVDLDFAAGDKVRLRGGPTGGDMQDTVITLWFRWRTA